MELPDYKPNTREYREKTREDERRAEKVIQGEIKTRKKSVGRKLADSFISEDAENIKSYVYEDVVIPTIKNTIISCIEMLLNGGSQRRQSSPSSYRGRSDRISYDRQYYSGDRRERPMTSYRRNDYVFDDVIFDRMSDADHVLEKMDGIIRDYGMVRVADFNELVGRSSRHTDCNYGWSDIRSARIRGSRGEYWIDLPPVTQLT